MMFILAVYLIVVGVLVTKYHTWAPKNVAKVALFVIPVPLIILSMLLVLLIGKVTKTDITSIADELQQSCDMIEDIIKDET
ncbi:Phage protein [Salmonella phage Tennessee]